MPPTLSNAGDKLTPSKSPTPDDVLDIFNAPDEVVPEPKNKELPKTKEPDEDEEEITEPEEDELELKEPEEEVEKLNLTEDEDIEVGAPPKKREILAKYPDIFKTFPFLEKMLYRDRQYNELFGSFDDAKELAERAESFDSLERELLEGNTASMLQEIKDTDERAFDIIVDDYLPTLAKVDEKAYFHVVGNLNKRLIMEMWQEGEKTKNEDMKTAALLVNQYVFGNSDFTAPKNRVDRSKEDKKSEVEAERLSYVRRDFERSRDDLQTRVDNTLKVTIDSYIDPRGNMSSYVKKNAINDALTHLRHSIAADESVVKTLEKLWRVAFDDNFSKDSLSQIQSYYLSKAKRNLKSAILKARAEALKDTRPSRNEKEMDETEEEENVRTPPRRISGTPPRPNKTNKNQRQKGESVSEFFMRD